MERYPSLKSRFEVHRLWSEKEYGLHVVVRLAKTVLNSILIQHFVKGYHERWDMSILYKCYLWLASPSEVRNEILSNILIKKKTFLILSDHIILIEGSKTMYNNLFRKLKWVGASSRTPKVWGLISDQDIHQKDVHSIPCQGTYGRQLINVSASLSLSLKSIKIFVGENLKKENKEINICHFWNPI